MFNRILFSIGSLSVGAALVMGLMHVTSLARVSISVAMVLTMLYVCYMVKRLSAQPARAVYFADAEAERYTEAEVRELFRGLAEAKAKSAHPFYAARTAEPDSLTADGIHHRMNP
jgi:hypothetical protein